MDSGWRRAFCSTTPKARREATPTNARAAAEQPHSDHSTPRLSCKTTAAEDDILINPKLQCNTNQKSHSNSPRIHVGSNSSPRSPFSILKNTLRLSRSSCGVCMQSVKTGQGMAIYTAECAHCFHFPCIALYVRKQDALDCPVCGTTWKDVPLLSIHKPTQYQSHEGVEKIVVASNAPTRNTPLSSSNCAKKGYVRSYADDEPLVSPKFNHISKYNQEREAAGSLQEDVEEFQGFFVNPISSSDSSFALNKYSKHVEVSLSSDAAVISVNQTHETYAVVLKVRAPPPPPPPRAAAVSSLDTDAVRRAPIDLVTVLDATESMSGAKLRMLKRTMHLLISSLGSVDRLSVVTFSAAPKRVMPLLRMTSQGQRSARNVVDRLTCSRGSCMSEALKEATKVLDDRRERNPVASVILLSDGHDDIVVTNTDTNQRRGSSTRFAHIEIPVNSSEFVENAAGLARQPAEEAFSKCVGGLLSVVVHDLKIKLGFASGSDRAEITAVYSCTGLPSVLSSDCIRLGNLYAEEERELFVELRVPISATAPHHVFAVSCSHKDPATQEVICSREHTLLVPRPHTILSGSRSIEHLKYAFIASRALAESRRLIECQDLRCASQLLISARGLLLQSRSDFAMEHVKVIETELAEVQWRQFQRRGGECGLL